MKRSATEPQGSKRPRLASSALLELPIETFLECTKHLAKRWRTSLATTCKHLHQLTTEHNAYVLLAREAMLLDRAMETLRTKIHANQINWPAIIQQANRGVFIRKDWVQKCMHEGRKSQWTTEFVELHLTTSLGETMETLEARVLKILENNTLDAPQNLTWEKAYSTQEFEHSRDEKGEIKITMIKYALFKLGIEHKDKELPQPNCKLVDLENQIDLNQEVKYRFHIYALCYQQSTPKTRKHESYQLCTTEDNLLTLKKTS